MVAVFLGIFIFHVATVFGHGGSTDGGANSAAAANGEREAVVPRLLLLSVDGFRHNFIEMMREKGTPLVNLERLARSGVYASMRPQFPSETFVNHVSIMTGLYPTEHGVVGNVYYDSHLNISFDPAHIVEQWFDERLCSMFSAQQDGAEPLWYTNERQRSPAHPFRRSGVHLWPCAYRFRGTQPTAFEARFDAAISMRARIDRVLGWFVGEDIKEPGRSGDTMLTDSAHVQQTLSADSNGRPVNFATLYYENVDETAHKFGPESVEVSDALLSFDSDVGYLMERIEAMRDRFEHASDWLNVVIVSDHGFAAVESTDRSRTIKLSDILGVLNDNRAGSTPANNRVQIDSFSLHSLFAAGYNVDLFERSSGRPYASSDADLAAMNRVHPAVHVYRVSDMQPYAAPAELRFAVAPHSPAAARLRSTLLLTEPGYLIENDYFTFNRTKRSRGTHGYNQYQPSMYAVFIARGPAFRVGLRMPPDEPLENVDLYPLLCTILQLKPAPSNGSLQNVRALLALGSGSREPARTRSVYAYALGTFTMLGALMVVCGVVLRNRTTATRFKAKVTNANHEAKTPWHFDRYAQAAFGNREGASLVARGRLASMKSPAVHHSLGDTVIDAANASSGKAFSPR